MPWVAPTEITQSQARIRLPYRAVSVCSSSAPVASAHGRLF